jgi:hypothetical protein
LSGTESARRVDASRKPEYVHSPRLTFTKR